MALLSISEAVDRYRISIPHLRTLVASGTIRGVKFGKTWVVDDESLRDYLAVEHKRGPKAKRKNVD